MSNFLPPFFLVLAAVALVAALLALWQSLRAMSGASEGIVTASMDELEDRAKLLDEKQMLLRAIKDLELEHALGKLSDQDYQRLDRTHRNRAKEILQALDEQARPYNEQAEALVTARLKRLDVAKTGAAVATADGARADAQTEASREGQT